ncbi:alcohol dehydrogenase [Kushneria pakistanensis]|uniref:Alcohol dehydrogenase n=1 Tax=Kushneria pakistanensis TaxID=1508770 RepID=A0ABQ3FET0_9GAMM|nr:zinc-dependent alcohol dehydrogenase family protein [Kushneria pakistanensis]GHC21526.1 alcohol dehydrogenase [Kushneria pakistanensis]
MNVATAHATTRPAAHCLSAMAAPALRYHRFGSPLSVLNLEPMPTGELPLELMRVDMRCAPINPSDLIPITGAYRHRLTPPLVAGHEGVGVVTQAHGPWQQLLGQRVLPLRGPGTWATRIDCDPRLAIPVPDDIPDEVAARAWINPMAALTMLNRWPVAGCHVLLTAAGSGCAQLLGQWALYCGARSVTGICRHPEQHQTLSDMGITLLGQHEHEAIAAAAGRAERVFDATGGALADHILAYLPGDGLLIAYGLLSGAPISPALMGPRIRRFHLRDHLIGLALQEWHDTFTTLWALLRDIDMPPVEEFALNQWQQALECFDGVRSAKPMFRLSH